MNILPKLSTALVILITFNFSFGQKLISPEDNKYWGRFIRYDLPDIGNHAVYYFYFDKKGFLWLGTMNRLYRYDGPEFKRLGFTSSDSTGFEGKQVTGICEDSTGNLWISTTGALNYFNIKSETFNHYFPDTTDVMSDNNRILYLYKDKKSTLWMITSADIFSFNIEDRKFQQFTIDPDSRLTGIQKTSGKIFEDSSGRIWFSTPYGLYMHIIGEDKLVVFKHNVKNPGSLSGNHVSCITEDSSHNIWIATLDGGLNRLKDAEKGFFEKINLNVKAEYAHQFDTIRTLLPDMDGSLWIFGTNMFGCYSLLDKNFDGYIIPPAIFFGRQYAEQTNIEFAFQTQPGEIWFLQLQGLMFRFIKMTESIALFHVPNFITFHAVKDNTGFFWFSCPSDFVWRLILDSTPMQSINVINKYSVSLVYTSWIVEDPEKNIWFNFSSGIHTAENKEITSRIKLKKFYFPDGDSIADCISKDHEGNIWISRPDGRIVKKEWSTNKFSEYRIPGNFNQRICNIKADSHGNLWLYGNKKMFRKQLNSERIEEYNFGDSIVNSCFKLTIFDFIIDKQDNIWFATFDNGTYVYNLKKKVTHHYTASSGFNIKTGDYCWRIKEGPDGTIWVLYSMNGLYMFDNEKKVLINIDLGNEIPSGTTYLDFIIDRDGRIRISHSNGLTILDPLSQKVRNYPFNLRMSNCFSYQLSSGEILLNSGPDLFLFRDPIPSNLIAPDVYITSLLVNNIQYNKLYPKADEIRLAKSIDLNFRQNNLRIEYTALNYLDSKNNMYRYMMKGIDNDTITTTSTNKITEYKKMQPGKYLFWFTGSNNDGVWNQTGKTIEIIIHPPWYRSLLAYIGYIILLIILIVLFIQWRTNILKKEKLRLEAEVADRTSELKNKNQQIEELDRLKTNFFTSISHEIRTPLSLIIGPIDNLIRESEETDNERQTKWMAIIKRNATRLLNLVNQLLDISRIDAGKMKLTLAGSDIIKCLRMLVYEYLSMAESRKIRFVINIPDEPFITFFDKDKTEKIVSNLLSNAFKFTPAYGTVSCKIEISGKNERDHSGNLLIEIKDTGSGMKKEHLDRIFDRFYRIDGQWEKDGAGTGIGLSLVEEFVTLLHGKIEVSSEQGLGSTFIVRIPLGKEHLQKEEYVMVDTHPDEDTLQQQLIDHHVEIVESEFEAIGKRPHVLIVEDNADLRTFIRENIAHEYSVFEADNGNTGLSIAYSKIPDLVITDIIMPDIDGMELCKRLKEDERTSHIPVIMLTAKTKTEEKIEGLTSGADDYMFKPFDMNELKVRISNLLLQREKLRLKFGMLTGYEQTDKTSASIDEKFMIRTGKIINENIGDFEFDVGVLQEKIGMSRVHLYRKLKAITGLSPSMIIRNYRIKKAAKLINEKAGNLTEIALSVGFSNPAYFSKCFRDYFGVSPKDFNSSQYEQQETGRS